MNMVDTMDPALNGDYPVYEDYPDSTNQLQYLARNDEDEFT